MSKGSNNFRRAVLAQYRAKEDAKEDPRSQRYAAALGFGDDSWKLIPGAVRDVEAVLSAADEEQVELRAMHEMLALAQSLERRAMHLEGILARVHALVDEWTDAAASGHPDCSVGDLRRALTAHEEA